jgi:hypothetical protein
MIDNTKSFIIKILIYSILFFMFIYGHEMVHKDIAKYHGCIDSEIKFEIGYATMICNEYTDRSVEIQLQERWLHSLNELISYNIIILYILMVILKELNEV